MNVRNCRKCGKIFNYVTGPVICPVCKGELEEKFQEVKKYVEDHRGVGIAQVAEECDVETSQLQQWIREERLEFSSDSDIGVPCEKCGAMIRSGRFCDKCKAEMTNSFNRVVRDSRPAPAPAPKKPTDADNPKMRFL